MRLVIRQQRHLVPSPLWWTFQWTSKTCHASGETQTFDSANFAAMLEWRQVLEFESKWTRRVRNDQVGWRCCALWLCSVVIGIELESIPKVSFRILYPIFQVSNYRIRIFVLQFFEFFRLLNFSVFRIFELFRIFEFFNFSIFCIFEFL